MKHIQAGFCSNVKLMLPLTKESDFVIKELDLVDQSRKNKIIRAGDYTVTLYQSNCSKIHVTGVKNFEQIPSLLKFLSERIDLSIGQISEMYIVNNSTWHFQVKERIPLQRLAEFLNELSTDVFSWKFNPQKFPGLSIKWPQGCAILFNTGKINILGVKSPAEFFRIRMKVLYIIYTL